MGMFDSFTGQSDGYTRAQRTGLRRSAGIKKKRKEEERAFEKAQEREKGERALTEKKMMEAGETRRTAMGEAGSTTRERMSNIGMMARQRLVGKQGVEAVRVGGVRAANIASMKYARDKTMSEIGHTQAMELAKTKDSLAGLFESPGSVARSGLPGDQKESPEEYTFAQFTDLPLKKQKSYMSYMKKNDSEKYLDFARQWKLLAAPKEETNDMDIGGGGRSIYQSDSGTYRNF